MKLLEILKANADDLAVEEIEAAATYLARKYYDVEKMREDLLTLLPTLQLSEIQTSPGHYGVSMDFLGDMDTAARTFGLKELGINQAVEGYRYVDAMDAEPVESIDLLPDIDQKIITYANDVAQDLTSEMDLGAGFFDFDFQNEYGDQGLRLFFRFADSDLKGLEILGVKFPEGTAEGREVVEMSLQDERSFYEIISALEQEDCGDLADRLHRILLGLE